MGKREGEVVAPGIQEHIRSILLMLGEDPGRPGLQDTPGRVSRALQELTQGYFDNPEDWMRTFEEDHTDQMICQWNIPTYSLCEHHMLPFVGYTHIGYIPKVKVLGLSKFSRVVNLFARRLQIQERMTKQIADFLEEHLEPRGVMVVVEAEHFCMTMRGVQSPGTRTTTSAVSGDYLDRAEGSRDEFLTLLNHNRRESR